MTEYEAEKELKREKIKIIVYVFRNVIIKMITNLDPTAMNYGHYVAGIHPNGNSNYSSVGGLSHCVCLCCVLGSLTFYKHEKS